MSPLLDQSHLDVAWHAGQYQALPEVYSRTARSRSRGPGSCRRPERAKDASSRRSSRRGTRASTSTTRRTGSARSGCSSPAPRRCRRSDARRMLRRREGREPRDALLRRRLAALDLPQGDDRRRARRAGPRSRTRTGLLAVSRDRRGSRARRRRTRSAGRRADVLGSLPAHAAEPRVRDREGDRRGRERAPRHQGEGARRARVRALRRADARRRSRSTGRTAGRRERERGR